MSPPTDFDLAEGYIASQLPVGNIDPYALEEMKESHPYNSAIPGPAASEGETKLAWDNLGLVLGMNDQDTDELLPKWDDYVDWCGGEPV
jgi:hypothetical protein